ncbi:MAG: alanine racemase [Opitutales bacterium]|nr:alanine racemase [Opitutales bacterium]
MEFNSTQLRASIQIDLYALERNLGRIKNFLPSSRSYIALVSADAFGIGLEAAVARLMLSGADAFAVTNLAEAVRVRRVGAGWPVIVLSASIPGEESQFISNDITPTIASLAEAKRFSAAAKELGKTAAVHLKLPSDTPEISIPDAAEAERILDFALADKNLNLEAFCVAGTGTGAPEMPEVPDKNFLKIAAQKIKAAGKNIYAHHSDIFDTKILPPEFEPSLRAGLVLFGVQPEKNSMLAQFCPEQVLSFKAAIAHIKDLPKGAYIGYSHTYQLAEDSKIALISAGYGDGLARSLGGKANVIVRDTLLPMVGIVSMDQAAVNASKLPNIGLSDEVIIIGASQSHKITIEDYCRTINITPAEALTAITQRVVRFYSAGTIK